MLITTENVRFGYDDKIILDNISFVISEKERVGLIGANGEGKTTLIKLLTGALSPDEGKIYKKSGLKIGVLEQNGGLESDKTVYEEMQSVFAGVFRAMQSLRDIEKSLASVPYGGTEFKELSSRYEQLERSIAAADGYNTDVKIKTVLNGMGFSQMYGQKISTMSGGEKTRLKLCRLLLEEPEILFLDEPTNHLDVTTLFWLEEYLKDYRGAIFTVSHDRYFIERLADKILEIDGGKITLHACGYAEYTAARKAAQESAETAAKAAKAEEKTAAKESGYRSKAERAEEAKKKLKRKETEEKITALEQEIDSLNEEIARPEVTADYKILGEKCARLEQLHTQLDEAYALYETLLD